MQRLLIVEDDAGVRTTIVNFLELEGYAVDAVSSSDEALDRLSQRDARMTHVAEMRYFGGLTEEEIGTALGLTTRTAHRDWEKARVLLREVLH